MKMPTSKSGGARFRGPTSSSEYNANEDQKYLELIELYKEANNTSLQLQEAHQVILAENAALHNYVKMLESNMANLEKRLQSLGGSSFLNGQFFQTSFVQSMTGTYPKESQNNQVTLTRCKVDSQHRYATIPVISEIPKTHLIDDEGNRIVPSELGIKVGRSSTKGVVVDNDILNAFNGNNLSFWRRTVTYDSPADIPTNGEDVVLEIELPAHLVNNLNINTIEVHPHPEKGIQVQNIELHYNNGWQTIKGFKQSEITSITSNEYSSRRKWYFPSVPVQKVRITLVQKNGMTVGGKTVFSLGAQEIGVYLTMFEPSGGMILTPFDMSGSYNIEFVEQVFLNREAFSYSKNMEQELEGSIFDYEVYVEESDKTLRPILNNEWTNQTAKRVWIKTNLYQDPNNGVNPCLHAVRLHYTKT